MQPVFSLGTNSNHSLQTGGRLEPSVYPRLPMRLPVDFSKPQLYPTAALPMIKKLEKALDLFPSNIRHPITGHSGKVITDIASCRFEDI